MDSSVSRKDEFWFLCVCHHVPHELYLYKKFYENRSLVKYVVLVSEGLEQEARLLAGDGNVTLIFMLSGNYYVSEVRSNY